MATLIPENFETVAPTEADAVLARESSRRLATHKLGRRSSVRIQLLDDGEETEAVVVPASAVRLFLHLLIEMSQGNAVTLIPNHAELTTQQAADLLNVSRPYLVKLLDEERIPCRTIGTRHAIIECDRSNNVAISEHPVQVPLELLLTSSVSAIREDAADPRVRIVVTRTGHVGTPLDVSLSSSDTSELTVPQRVTIPAGS